MVHCIDQFCAGFSSGDAISKEALTLQAYLRSLGFQSEIYSENFSEDDAGNVYHYRQYHAKKNSIIIYHHSFYTHILDVLPDYPARKVLIFHNITPPEFVLPYSRHLADKLIRARTSLHRIQNIFDLVLADSHFNAVDLHEMGAREVEVLPVAIDFSQNLNQDQGQSREGNNGAIENKYDSKTGSQQKKQNGKKRRILFVGRIFPNKKHQDIIKAFYFLKKIQPDSELILAGAFHPGVRGYTKELKNLIAGLGLQNSIIFTDYIPENTIQEYYRSADLFLSMSEHEGFFVPLLESMHHEIPIMAYGSSVIPETLQNSGIIFYQKDYLTIAGLINEVLESEKLCQGLVKGQKKRIQDFDIRKILAMFHNYMARIIDMPRQVQ